ncbi:MAG: hypothetical protein DRR15_07530 [Gammaproteobacteria bacterium]|nr:MAG: hypothetical protein DRR15_07530 [Gammaproteobacteria bacterium]
MNNERQHIDDHVVEQLSGYVDGELTQQQRQRVDVHCASCAECAKDLHELQELRESIGNARLSNKNQDEWREMMNDTTVQTTRGIGWLLLIGGVLVCMGIGVFVFLFGSSVSLVEKLIVSAIYGGLALLFYSVLRQRLIERKTDKYKDVEI